MNSVKKVEKRFASRAERFKGLAQQLRGAAGDSRLLDSQLSRGVGFVLRAAAGVVEDRAARRFDQFGIRQSLFSLLVIIAEYPGLKQHEIGQILAIQQPNLVALINELESMGLVSREANAGDRRSYSLVISAEGSRILEQAKRVHAEHERRVAEAIAPMSLEEFKAVLGRIVDLSMDED